MIKLTCITFSFSEETRTFKRTWLLENSTFNKRMKELTNLKSKFKNNIIKYH